MRAALKQPRPKGYVNTDVSQKKGRIMAIQPDFLVQHLETRTTATPTWLRYSNPTPELAEARKTLRMHAHAAPFEAFRIVIQDEDGQHEYAAVIGAEHLFVSSMVQHIAPGARLVGYRIGTFTQAFGRVQTVTKTTATQGERLQLEFDRGKPLTVDNAAEMYYALSDVDTWEDAVTQR